MDKEEDNGSIVSSAGKKIVLMLFLLLLVVLTGTLVVRESLTIGNKAATLIDYYCTSNCCYAPNYPNYWVNHYWSYNPDDPVVNDIALCEGCRSACFAKNCGAEQIDVGNSAGKTPKSIWTKYNKPCEIVTPPERTPTPTSPPPSLTCASWTNVWIRTATGDCNSYDIYSRDDPRCKTTTGNINVINNVSRINPTSANITQVKYGNLYWESNCLIYGTTLSSVWDEKPWERYTTNKPFDFGAGTGQRKVCAQFRSATGATTPICGAMVKLEAPSPTPTKRATPTPTKTPTITPTKFITPTRPPTITPTRRVTPTPTPTTRVTITPTAPPISCTNFGIDEHSGSHSNLVEIGLDPKSLVASVILRKRLDCKTGDKICDGEGMDNYPGTNNVYFIMNSVKGGKPTIFRVTNRETGSYTKVRELTSSTKFYALSFHPGNKNLYGWSKGGGLYIINLSNGNISRELSSNLDITGMTWSLDGLNLYGIASGRIYRFSYNSSNKAVRPAGTVGSLSGDIDAMDMTSDGKIVVLYRKSGNVYMNFLSVSSSRTRLTRRFRISSFISLSKAELSNIDGFAWLCGRAP